WGRGRALTASRSAGPAGSSRSFPLRLSTSCTKWSRRGRRATVPGTVAARLRPELDAPGQPFARARAPEHRSASARWICQAATGGGGPGRRKQLFGCRRGGLAEGDEELELGLVVTDDRSHQVLASGAQWVETVEQLDGAPCQVPGPPQVEVEPLLH